MLYLPTVLNDGAFYAIYERNKSHCRRSHCSGYSDITPTRLTIVAS